MICDHVGCKATPMRAPRVIVPPTIIQPDFPPLRMMTTLHFCEQHKGEVKLGDLLNDKIKADFEATARRKRPLGFKCDFEAAFIDYLLVTTPEYRAFLSKISIAKLVRENA